MRSRQLHDHQVGKSHLTVLRNLLFSSCIAIDESAVVRTGFDDIDDDIDPRPVRTKFGDRF